MKVSARLTFGAASACFAASALAGSGPAVLSHTQANVLARSSMSFVENKGQWDSRVQFLAKAPA